MKSSIFYNAIITRPELVSKDDNEMLAVNYQGLVPVLINALKEQDEKISKLEKLVEQLISEK